MEDEFGLGVSMDLAFDQAVMRTRLALRTHGFSILSEMPAPARVGEEGRKHLFMTVWERMISTGNLGGPGLDVGDHLPCNVVVFESEGQTVVAGLDPTDGLEGWGGDTTFSEAARTALERVMEQVDSEPG